MKRLVLGLVLAAASLLLIPMTATAAEFETFVGCDDLSANPVPSHVCQTSDFPGAYFESDLEVEYEVCVEFPGGTSICAEDQLAEADVLYVNSITTDQEGEHFVSWFVEGTEVGNWAFRMESPPPPPPAVVTSPPPPAPTPIVSPPSAKCLKAKQAVNRLKGRLRKAVGRKQKAKIRTRLKRARAAARAAC